MRLLLGLLALTRILLAGPTITAAGSCPVEVGSSEIGAFAASGSGFVQGSVLSFGGTPTATTLLSPTLLSAVVPASLLTVSGKIPVVVTNPDGSVSNAFGCVVQPVLDVVKDGVYGAPASRPEQP